MPNFEIFIELGNINNLNLVHSGECFFRRIALYKKNMASGKNILCTIVQDYAICEISQNCKRAGSVHPRSLTLNEMHNPTIVPTSNRPEMLNNKYLKKKWTGSRRCGLRHSLLFVGHSSGFKILKQGNYNRYTGPWPEKESPGYNGKQRKVGRRPFHAKAVAQSGRRCGRPWCSLQKVGK